MFASRFFVLALGALGALGLAMLPASPASAAPVNDPTGVWVDAEGRGAVEISHCGSSGALCGRVVWVKSREHQGRCGVQILGNLEKSRNGAWGSGWIYSPDYDRRFDVEVKRLGPDRLRVVGWAGVRMFSETHVWTRAPTDLARCGADATLAATTTREARETVAMAKPPAAPAAPAAAVADPVAEPAAKAATIPARPTEAAPVPVPTASAMKPRAEKAKRSGQTADKRSSRVASAGGKAVNTRYFKRTAGGSCRVDTPWIKLTFDCRRL